MSRIIYNADTLKIMQIFDSITKSELKDCFIDNNDLLTFVVSKNQMGKAIGKKAANVKRIEQLLKRKIKVVEFSDDITKFIKSLIYPVSTAEISENDQIVTIKLKDNHSKSVLIGRSASNLRNLEGIVKKYFTIKEIKVM